MQPLSTLYPESHDDWRLLRVYVAYRVVLAFLLLILFSINPDNLLIGGHNPSLFLITSIIYLFLTVTSLVLSKKYVPNLDYKLSFLY
jgi:two-component system sensor histidine kinase PilS (NtrC family)